MYEYELTFVDTGKTIQLTEAKCRKKFGAKEWKEIKAGHLPNIIATKLPANGSPGPKSLSSLFRF